MTLVACPQGKDGLVLAADSRGTIGDPRGLTAIRDSETKLFELTKYVGIVSYGQAELAAQLIVEIRGALEPNEKHFSAVFEKARRVSKDKYEGWFGGIPREHRQVVGFIVAGFEENGDKKIYYLSSPLDFAPQLCTAGTALAGIPQYATYLVHRLYDPQMSRKNLIFLAAYIIAETATQDPKVGGRIRIAEIAPDTGYTELPHAEVSEAIEHNSELNERLRDFFFPKEG